MKNKSIMVMMTAAALLLNGAVTASADEVPSASAADTSVSAGTVKEPEIITFDTNKDKHDGTVYTYDECVAIIFSKTWGNKYDDGVTFPQQSLTYHEIRTFLDEYYLTDKGLYGQWDKYFDILNKWDWYCSETAEPGLKTKDDDNGHYIVVDKETGDIVYTYELVDNVWKKLDKDGNVVDSFDPHPVGDKSEYDSIIGNESSAAEASLSKQTEVEPMDAEPRAVKGVNGLVTTAAAKLAETITTAEKENVQAKSEEPDGSSESASATDKEESSDKWSTLKIIGGILVMIVVAIAAKINVNKKRKK